MKQFIENKIDLEVWNILEAKNEIKTKIPEDVLKHIYKNAKKVGYSFEYNSDEEILNQVSREAFCLYVSLYLQYVASDEEKAKLKETLIENEVKLKGGKI